MQTVGHTFSLHQSSPACIHARRPESAHGDTDCAAGSLETPAFDCAESRDPAERDTPPPNWIGYT